VLAAAGLVTTRRQGTRIYYRLASPRVTDLWAALRDVAAAHHEALDDLATAYLGDRTRLEQIGRDELAERMASGDVVVIDVRPSAEYAAGHIAGAVSIPIDDLAANIAALPADLEVVAYCRGPYCVFADDAVRLLRRRGRSAHRLQDGFPEWRCAELPVEVGAAS
jgi:rhodanese-related sulfurtransferase